MHIVFDHTRGMFRTEELHMSLFRANDLLILKKEDGKVERIFREINWEIRLALAQGGKGEK